MNATSTDDRTATGWDALPDARTAGGLTVWLGLAALAYLLYLVVAPFLTAFGWAAVLAVAVYPVHAALERRVGKTVAAAAATFTVALILVLPLLLLVPLFVREAIEWAGRVQRFVADGRLDAWFERFRAMVPGGLNLQSESGDVTGDLLRGATSQVVSASGLVLQDLAQSLVNVVVALFTMFFLLRDAPAIMRIVRRVLPLPADLQDELIARTVAIVSVTLSSAVIVAIVQGAIGGLVFFALGIQTPVFWGIVMAVFCLLPFGAWVVWLPAAALLALEGHVGRALLLAGLGLSMVSAADNVLRPMLVSGRTHMNGLVVLVGLLGGLAVFGLLGLVLGPLIVVTALALVTAYADAKETRSFRRSLSAHDAAV